MPFRSKTGCSGKVEQPVFVFTWFPLISVNYFSFSIDWLLLSWRFGPFWPGANGRQG